MLPIEQRFLTENDCFRAGRTISPQGVMVHSTGTAQPDPEVFCRAWNRSGVEACVHAFVSEDRILQTLPWNFRGWHAGTGERGSANNTHISFECCEPAGHSYQGGAMVGYDPEKNQTYFRRVYQNAVDLCALLCREYGLDPLKPGVVLCHAEGFRQGVASNHADVLHWWPRHGADMDGFRRDVRRAMEEQEELMTQEQFNAMLEAALTARGERPPSPWSQQARAWAESAGIVAGERVEERRYPAFATREETVQMLYRLSQAQGPVSSAPPETR